MKYHWVRLYALLLMIVMFATAILSASRGAFNIYNESARQRAVIKGVQTINAASDAIMKNITDIARDAGRQQYDRILELISIEDDSRMSENDLEGYFRVGYANRIKSEIGMSSQLICDRLNSFLETENLSGVYVNNSSDTVMDEELDENGFTTALLIKNVTISYDDPVIGNRSDTISYNIRFPDAVFHPGNDELFSYCLVARKGIYFTGPTSSVIGDIFAGRHRAEESRDAEVIYGEIGTYGGLNILSTQLGIKADRIVSEGDININGSFVNFTPNYSLLTCFAQRINETDSYSKSSGYVFEGDFIPTVQMEENDLTDYHEAINLVDSSMARLGEISLYYDSNNDGGYSGKYRKLVSDSDIELKDDFTGIVVTPANVIINNNVNFEGIILCGDRIYARGNNNIVSNPVVARSVIASESGTYYGFRIKDYIGGIKTAGLRDPEHYVIPYR